MAVGKGRGGGCTVGHIHIYLTRHHVYSRIHGVVPGLESDYYSECTCLNLIILQFILLNCGMSMRCNIREV